MRVAPAAWARRSASSIVGENSRSLVAGHGDEVGALEGLQPVGHVEGQSVEQVDRPLRMLGADPEVERGHTLGGAVEPEDLVDHPELEGGGLVGEEDGDGLEGHTGDDRTIGRNLSIGVLSATCGGKSMSA